MGLLECLEHPSLSQEAVHRYVIIKTKFSPIAMEVTLP